MDIFPLVFYSVLAHSGYFPVKELATFRKLNSRLQGHPTTHEHLEGVRMASGSLGQGLSNAIGAALAKKLNKDNSIVYTLHGDGELQEGQIWEAAMYASAKNVDNLIATVDMNGQQIDGSTDKVLNMGSLRAKFEAFGWDVLDLEKGNDIASVVTALNTAKAHTGKGKPVMILMKTEMGNGVDFMMGSHKWHGVAPNDEQLAQALSQNAETLGRLLEPQRVVDPMHSRPVNNDKKYYFSTDYKYRLNMGSDQERGFCFRLLPLILASSFLFKCCNKQNH
jgi:transketolase